MKGAVVVLPTREHRRRVTYFLGFDDFHLPYFFVVVLILLRFLLNYLILRFVVFIMGLMRLFLGRSFGVISCGA